MKTGRNAKTSATVTAGQTPKPGGKAVPSGNSSSRQTQPAAVTAGQTPKPGGKAVPSGNSSSRQTQPVAKPRPAVTPTHEQIARRAEHIWRQGGCLPGRDEQNWQEAEAQLKAEFDVN